MKKVHLVIEDEKILHFIGKQALNDAGFVKADKVVTEEEFNSNGCYAKIVDGEIIIGMTDEERELQERQIRIDEIEAQLHALDQEYLTPRILAGNARGDAYAIGKVEQHEELAEPLREELQELLQN